MIQALGRDLVSGEFKETVLKILGWLLMFAVLASPALGAEIPKVGGKAPEFTLKDLAGGSFSLGEGLKSGPVVLVVLRGYPGYQCPLCTAQVAEIARRAEQFQKAGTQVVLVYPGPADQLKGRADEFLKGKALPEGMRLLLDPDYGFTNAYGLRWDAPNETAYPSAFVIAADGTIGYAKVSRSHGGRAKTADLLAGLKKVK